MVKNFKRKIEDVYATGMPKQVMTVKMFKEVYKVNAEMIERDNESFVIIKDAI